MWGRAMAHRVVRDGLSKQVTFQVTHEEGKTGNLETSQG